MDKGGKSEGGSPWRGATSQRHAGILNGVMNGDSPYRIWADEQLALIAIDRWAWGEIDFSWDIDERHIMPDGVMFGGHVASVADYVTSLAAMTVLTEDNQRFRTSHLSVDYFRPVKRPAAMIKGRVTNVSRSLIHVEADVFNEDKKRLVRMSATEVRRVADQ